MAFCHNIAASQLNMHWHHPVVSPAAAPLRPPANDAYYYSGGARDYNVCPTAGSFLPPYPCRMSMSTTPINGAENGVGRNLTSTVPAPPSPQNGYQHVGPPNYALASSISASSSSSNYSFPPPHHPGLAQSTPPTPAPPIVHPSSPFNIVGQPMHGFLPNGNCTNSSNRELRNQAEKKRRNKLNESIGHLASLVPMVSNSPKRLDKTSILRLAVTFLRMQRLLPATVDQNLRLPPFLINKVNWFQMLVNHIDGSLLIITSVGKIVFVTHNIEEILGFTQLELLGLSLFNITSPEDHLELKNSLSPDENNENATDSTGEMEDLKVTSSELITKSSSRSCTSRSSSFIKTSCSSQYSNDNTPGYDKQRRSFFLRLSHRNPTRSEKPHYELVRIQGHLMVPKKFASQTQKKSQKHEVEVPSTNSNEIFLVAIMERLHEQRVTELSLLEPSKDEYITRHTLKGHILYTDHRISVVAGYMSEEVTGLQAFTYMHEEDAPWVLTALYQMFTHGDAFGLSCYRLRTKTGKYIHLKSYGYLEFNAATETYGSFICVNSMVSEDEGMRGIMEMKKRFTPTIDASEDKTLNTVSTDFLTYLENKTNCMDITSIINVMFSNLPTLRANSIHEDPKRSDLPQYLTAKIVSKRLPPVNVQMTNIEKIDSNSPSTTPKASPSSSPPSPQLLQPQENIKLEQQQPSISSAISPPVSCSSRTPQDRPSVLRIAPSSLSRQPVTVYDIDNDHISSTTCTGGVDNSSRPSGSCYSNNNRSDCISSIASSNNTDNGEDSDNIIDDEQQSSYASDYGDFKSSMIIQSEFIKQEMPDDDSFDQTPTNVTSSPASDNRTTSASVVRCAVSDSSAAAAARSLEPNDRIGVVVQRLRSTEGRDVGGIKRTYDFHDDPSQTPVSIQKRFKVENVDTLLKFHPSSLDGSTFGQLACAVDMKNSIHDSLNSLPNEFAGLPSADSPFVLGPDSENILKLMLSEENHLQLESTIQIQGAQINAIEHVLNENESDVVSHTSNKLYLNQLKHEHKAQNQFFQSIRQDCHNLQCRNLNSDRVNV